MVFSLTLPGKSKSSISGYCCSQSFCSRVKVRVIGEWTHACVRALCPPPAGRTHLVEHEELGVALVQVVLLPPHLDVHVVDRVPARGREQARGVKSVSHSPHTHPTSTQTHRFSPFPSSKISVSVRDEMRDRRASRSSACGDDDEAADDKAAAKAMALKDVLINHSKLGFCRLVARDDR